MVLAICIRTGIRRDDLTLSRSSAQPKAQKRQHFPPSPPQSPGMNFPKAHKHTLFPPFCPHQTGLTIPFTHFFNKRNLFTPPPQLFTTRTFFSNCRQTSDSTFCSVCPPHFFLQTYYNSPPTALRLPTLFRTHTHSHSLDRLTVFF